MFWRFGGYANISTIDTLLDKSDFTLEDLLDEGDLIQELKQHNSKLIEYLRDDGVLEKLLEYVVAPRLEPVETPDQPVDDERARTCLLPFSRPRASSRAADTSDNDYDEHEKHRNRYALVACEILCSETWSIYEALTENHDLIRRFWAFLSRPTPLDPLQASYFTRVNESLFEKKTEDMMALFRSLPNIVSDLLKHVECPMIMDLLLKIIALERVDGGQGVVEWLYTQDMMPTLLLCLDPERSWLVQTAAGDFIKAIITISANASQNEQQCIGPNELTRQLVSRPCVEQLIGYMLGGGNPLKVGVGIVIEVIRKNNSDYDPDVGSEVNSIPSSRDPIYLGMLLRLFADNVPNLMKLIMNGPARKQGLASTFGERLEPLGFDRFKTCELMAELLHCSNMGLLNEVGSERLIACRDVERQRLRIEGRLGPQKEDDQSTTDDLTMRIPQANLEEGRRLEVTNADDDGFEEVEPSREMSEDTSHEFIKAKDDMAVPLVSSFLDKDEDYLVDEPLSSPQLPFPADDMYEAQALADEASLFVAPLSPSKSKHVKSASLAVGPYQGPAQPLTNETDEGHESKVEITEIVTMPGLEPKPMNDADQRRWDESIATELGDASAHAEHTPAPLFWGAESTLVERPAQPAVDGAAEGTPETQESLMGTNESGRAQELTTAGPSASEALGEESQSRGPVVGDYLKMQFVDHQVIPAILSFFFAYPWNNFLHNVVYDVVQQVFNGPMDRGYNPTLAISLFEAADITSAIIHGQQASDVSQAQTKTRMGYMGHLTLIAEEVVKFTERHPPELLSENVLDKVMSQEWIHYVEGALAETRERDNAILGGVRPDLGHRGTMAENGLAGVGLADSLGGGAGAASSALAEAGLNGGIEMGEGAGSSTSPFAISSGPLMSGFGSSSDEEDEEGEVDEDVNSEFRAYADALNNSSKMIAPLSIPPPPPPPPLNVPPSRARLQLEARLAMHQRNSRGASNSSTTPHQDEREEVGDERKDEDEAEASRFAEGGRVSWLRGVLRGMGKRGDDESDDGNEEEFGDFAMAEDDKERQDEEPAHLLLRPLAVHPAKESSRGLSGLWPFGSRSDGKEKSKQENDKSDDSRDAGRSGKRDGDEGKHAVEVKEATSRTSIEEPDEDEVVVGAKELLRGTS